MQQETTDSRQPEKEGTDAQKKVEIVIVRHKQFFEMLKEPQTMWRVLLSLFFIIVVVTIGLALVIISIKRFYPYNTIQTNMYGATIMKNEDKEVIYWLFNTSELWANSGIKVKKNDELTIRASGASFTAIHHLVEAAKANTVLEYGWVDTDGQPKSKLSDILRGKYRIVSGNLNCDEGKLLMLVADEDKQNNSADWIKKSQGDELRKGDIEIIGKEKVALRIKRDGVLHFAVNDIVFTDTVIDQMYKEFVAFIMDKHPADFNKAKRDYIMSRITECLKGSCDLEGLKKLNQEYGFSNYSKVKTDATGLKLGNYPGPDSIYYPLINELVYYKRYKFRNAWFIDNIGSFLIVIERKR